MHTSAGRIEQELSRVEAQSLLRGKFLRISLKGNEYCFKVNAVKEIITNVNVMKREKDPGIIKDNRCGFIRFRNTTMPVFDLRAWVELLGQNWDENCFIIIIEAIANGLLLGLGILTNKISAIVNRSMDEMSEDVIRSRLQGTMHFPADEIQSCYEKNNLLTTSRCRL